MSYLVVLLSLVVSFSALAEDCIVKNQMDDFYFVKCENYNGERVLYLSNGKAVSVDSEFQDMLVVKKSTDVSLETGSSLSLKENIDNQVKPQNEMSLSAINIETQASPTALVPAKKDSVIRVRSSLFSHTLQNDSEDTINLLETSPADFSFEVNTRKIGFIITPSFKEDTSGEVAFYFKMKNLDLGVFGSIYNKQIKSNDTDELDRLTLMNGGLFLRLIGNYGNVISHFSTLKLGYVWGELVSGDGDESNNAEVDGTTIEIETNLYFRLATNVQLGLGLGLSYLTSETSLSTSSSPSAPKSVSDDLVIVKLYPVRLQFEF